MGTFKLILFLFLACAIAFALPFIPGVAGLLGSVACTPEETFEWRQTSAGTEVSYSWVCVDPEGRFNVSDTSVRGGEVAVFGIALAVGCVIAAVPFGVARAMRRRRTPG